MRARARYRPRRKAYNVTGIGKKAFAKAKKCKTVVVKAKGLSKSSVKKCFKGSKVKKVKLSGISGKAKKNYKKWLGKKSISGKKVKVS